MKTAVELRAQSREELVKLLLELRREQFNLRMQRCMEQLTKTSELRRVRRTISRVKTVLREQRGASVEVRETHA